MELKDAIKYINNAPQKIAKAAASAPKMLEKGARKLADLPRETYERADRELQQFSDQDAKHKQMAIKNGNFAKSKPAVNRFTRDPIGPDAQTGRISQRTEKSKNYATEAAAKESFRNQAEGLLRPDGWNNYTAGMGNALAPKWHHLDSNGKPVKNNPQLQKGDVFQIQVPGPDFFVRADRVNKGKDNVQFTLVPCGDPNAPANAKTAHFFTDESSRTFMLQRDGKEVRFVTEGNNEKLNVGGQSGYKAPVNAVVGTGIMGGVGEGYWNGFGNEVLKR